MNKNKRKYKVILIMAIVVSMLSLPSNTIVPVEADVAKKHLNTTKTADIETKISDMEQEYVALKTETENLKSARSADAIGGYEKSDWQFAETVDSIILQKYIGVKMDVEVPSTIDGKTVVIDPSTIPGSAAEDVKNNQFLPATITSLAITDTTNKVKYASASMRRWIASKSALVSLDLRGLDTSSVTSMMQAISSNIKLKSIDVTGFDTSNVTDMNNMFYGNKVLETLKGTQFNTTSVANMTNMFYGMSKLTTVDLTTFNTSQVTSFNAMFQGCESLTSIDTSNFNTQSAVDMSHMFNNCKSLGSVDVSNFDTSNVERMSHMFNYCESLTTVDVAGFDTSKVTQMAYMFYACGSLTTLDVSNFNTDKIVQISSMFTGCSSLTTLDVSNFNPAGANDLRYMFYGCTSLTSLNLSKFNTEKLLFMDQMFKECANIQVFDLSSFTDTVLKKIDKAFDIDPLVGNDVPTVIIGSLSLLDGVDNSIKGRVYAGPNYNANGGIFGDSSTTKKYFDHFVFKDKSEFTVTKETIATKETPTRAGAIFTGWYLDKECTQSFSTDTLTVDLLTPEYINLALYAGWEHQVTFDSHDGSAVAPVIVNSGNLLARPGTPTKTGYNFQGWYKEAGLTNEWDFNIDKVTTDMTLYAKWSEVPKHTVAIAEEKQKILKVYKDGVNEINDANSKQLTVNMTNKGADITADYDSLEWEVENIAGFEGKDEVCKIDETTGTIIGLKSGVAKVTVKLKTGYDPTNTETYDTVIIIVPGNVNKTGALALLDSIVVMRKVVGIDTLENMASSQNKEYLKELSDMDGDGKLTMFDVACINRMLGLLDAPSN